jgi:hypothetical protein
LPEVEPWPEPVDGASLLATLADTLCQYVIVTNVQATVIALWSLYTHVFDVFDA